MNDNKIVKGLALLMIAIILGVLLWPVMGERNKAYDEKLSSDVSEYQTAIDTFHSQNGRLPFDLGEVTDLMFMEIDSTRVDYNKVDATSYQLCADFKTDTTADGEAKPGFEAFYPDSTYVDVYSHEAGRVCFDMEVFRFGGFDDFSNDFTDEFNFDFDDFPTDSFEGFEGFDLQTQ